MSSRADPGPASDAAPRGLHCGELDGAVRLLQTHGQAATADVVRRKLSSGAPAVPTVVVVGEVTRGKSTLVNALIGRLDASPVGVDVVTAAFVRFVPDRDEAAEESAEIVGVDGSRWTVPVAELSEWVTTAGRHHGEEGRTLVRGAHVHIANSALPGIAIVDTPGVGGLDGGHARLAIGVAAQANVLLFVCDAGQPLSAPELSFLSRAAESVETVLVAMTKIDKHPGTWREVAAENVGLLRRHAPRLADTVIVGVSGLYACDAIPAHQHRDLLYQEANMSQLVTLLRSRMADVERLVMLNAVRTADSGLRQAEVQLATRRAVAIGDPVVRAALGTERARLAELRAQQQRWTLDLERDLGVLRRTTVADLATRLADLRDRWTLTIEGNRRGLVPGVAEQLMAQVCSELQALADGLSTDFEQRLTELVQRTFGTAAVPSRLTGVAADLRVVRPRPRDHSGRPAGLVDPALAATAFLGMGMAAKLPLAAAGAVGLLNPVALAVGGAWLAVNVAFRAVKAGRLRLRTWLAEVTQALQADLVAATDSSVGQVKPEIVISFREFLTTAVSDLDAVIREADRAAAAGVQERDNQLAALDRHLAAVAAQRRLLAALLTSAPSTDAGVEVPHAGTSSGHGASNR